MKNKVKIIPMLEAMMDGRSIWRGGRGFVSIFKIFSVRNDSLAAGMGSAWESFFVRLHQLFFESLPALANIAP